MRQHDTIGISMTNAADRPNGVTNSVVETSPCVNQDQSGEMRGIKKLSSVLPFIWMLLHCGQYFEKAHQGI
jgi:hypothetical protein